MYVCVVLVYFLNLRMSIFEKKIVEGNKHRCVNKTSRDKGAACANEKRKWCNPVPSEITLGRNYPWSKLPSVEITIGRNYPRSKLPSVEITLPRIFKITKYLQII